jgi:hypothetical protein
MKIPWFWLLSLLLFMAFTVILNGLQCGFWYLIFGSFPPPLLWLVALVYVSVTRTLWEATLMTYILTFVNSAFTAFPFEALLVYSLALMFMLMLIRERVFWGGATFFMLMVGVASLTAPILFWIASRWFDKNPVFIPQIFDWLISGLLTMLFSLPAYRMFQFLDVVASQDAGTEGHIGPR